ncbi:hypothetical protein [Pseudomonas sp. SCB32]|uniref:hypothetical protein n=1 Tax=Pseudomonas sp. SCB32 TaxID=2653853 RepID=UPI0012643616|nr:hypothetical protein [Pseudomonas sp. SCB32]
MERFEEVCENSTLFFVQQVDSDETGRCSLLLDPHTLDETVRFLARFLGGEADASNAEASIIEIDISGKPGQYDDLEGGWFWLDHSLLSEAIVTVVPAAGPGGLYLRAILTLRPFMDISRYFSTAKAPEIAERDIIAPNIRAPHFHRCSPKRIRTVLRVIDCGHGNWNELETSASRLLYDVGAGRWFTSEQVREVVAKRCLSDEIRDLQIVISHWDVDHYHAILAFEPDEISKVKWLMAPSNTPPTATFSRVEQRLRECFVSVYFLPFASTESAYIRSGEVSLLPVFTFESWVMLRATSGTKRNQSGIAMFVAGSRKIGILSGDHDYSQLLEAVWDTHYWSHRPRTCVLVAPHHGGHAGQMYADGWLRIFDRIRTPISCGKNRWGHPYPAVLKELYRMQNDDELPWLTKEQGDYVRVL